MFLLDLIYRFVDYMNSETNERVEKFIDETYFYYLRIAGIYPLLSRKYLPLAVIQISTYLGVLIFHMYVLLENSVYFMDKSFVLMSQEVHFFLLTVVASVLIGMNSTHRRDFSRIHRYMEHDYYDYEEGKSEVMEEFKRDVIRRKKRLLLVPLCASLNGGIVMFVSRLLDNYYGDFDAEKYDINFFLPFPCRNFEVIDTSHGFGYLLAAGGQLMCVTIMLPMAITGAGFVLVSVLLDFIRQLKFLLHNLETAEERARVHYAKLYGTRPTENGERVYNNDNFSKCYQAVINKCIDHHSILLSVFENITSFMGINFFTCFLIGSIIIALSANCVNSDNTLPGTTLANLALCLNEIAFMYLLSIFGQEISDLSDEIRYKFYGLKWYSGKRGIRTSILIMQEGSFRTMTIMGAKILPVNLSTFSNVMNSAYTYYNLLNAFNE